MWFIVVITVNDWYDIYQTVEIVKAANVCEATEKALAEHENYCEAMSVIQCKTKPKLIKEG